MKKCECLIENIFVNNNSQSDLYQFLLVGEYLGKCKWNNLAKYISDNSFLYSTKKLSLMFYRWKKKKKKEIGRTGQKEEV